MVASFATIVPSNKPAAVQLSASHPICSVWTGSWLLAEAAYQAVRERWTGNGVLHPLWDG